MIRCRGARTKRFNEGPKKKKLPAERSLTDGIQRRLSRVDDLALVIFDLVRSSRFKVEPSLDNDVRTVNSRMIRIGALVGDLDPTDSVSDDKMRISKAPI